MKRPLKRNTKSLFTSSLLSGIAACAILVAMPAIDGALSNTIDLGTSAYAGDAGGKGIGGIEGKHIGGRKGAGGGSGYGYGAQSGGQGRIKVPGESGSSHVPEGTEDDGGDDHGSGGDDHGSGSDDHGSDHAGGSDDHGDDHSGGEKSGQSSRPEGGRGGAPVWAKEGIPHVELGRLNVIRSPDQVIDRALAKAINEWDASKAALYEMSAEAAAALLATDFDNITRIDSPLQNLGLYRDLLEDGQTRMPGVTPASVVDLGAILLGSASDKTIPITTDTVNAVNIIMGLTINEADAAALATKAEAVRAGISVGHGE